MIYTFHVKLLRRLDQAGWCEWGMWHVWGEWGNTCKVFVGKRKLKESLG